MFHTSSLTLIRIHQLLRDNRGLKYFAIALIVLILTGSALLIWMNLQPSTSVPMTYPATIKKPEAPKYYSPLTGMDVGEEGPTKRPVTAVMIENSPDARPQSGLKDAGLVFEAIAEGGITRFIALYQESRPSLIGPVRSVRPYYVEWGATYDAGVAHVGGSSKALSMIRSGNYGVDMDQFFNPGAYWRSSDRRAPHNVYSSFDKLDALAASKDKTSSNLKPLERKDESKSDTPHATSINFPISSALYNVDYDYDASSNSYYRKVGGQPHVDREAGQIQPKVVIAMEVSMTKQMEDGYREQINTTGKGTVVVFQDGVATEGTWERGDVKDQFLFKDSAGKLIKLNRGSTWITALPQGRKASWR